MKTAKKTGRTTTGKSPLLRVALDAHELEAVKESARYSKRTVASWLAIAAREKRERDAIARYAFPTSNGHSLTAGSITAR